MSKATSRTKSFHRLWIASLAASVVSGTLVPLAEGETFTWVGGSNDTEQYNNPLLFGYGGNAPSDRVSGWATSAFNWAVNGETPGAFPGEDDVVIFATGFDPGMPLSRQNRAVRELRFADIDGSYVFENPNTNVPQPSPSGVL